MHSFFDNMVNWIAGIIVFRIKDGQNVEYLLVQRDTEEYGLPEGKVEDDESPLMRVTAINKVK